MNDFEWWKLIYWALATFGVAGTIALAVFAPAFFSIAFKGVVRLLSLVLSYRAGCALVAAIVAAVIASYWQHSTDDAKYAAEVAEYEKAQDARDKRIAQETKDEVWTEIANQTAQNKTVDDAVRELHDALPPVPHTADNPFRVGAYADRLRAIYGQSVRRSKGGATPVPKARRPGVSR